MRQDTRKYKKQKNSYPERGVPAPGYEKIRKTGKFVSREGMSAPGYEEA